MLKLAFLQITISRINILTLNLIFVTLPQKEENKIFKAVPRM